MNTTKQSLVCVLILMAGVVLGCRNVIREEVPKIIKPAAERAMKGGFDAATKQTVRSSMRSAARSGGTDAAGEQFDKLFSRKDSPFRDYIKDFGETQKRNFRDLLI